MAGPQPGLNFANGVPLVVGAVEDGSFNLAAGASKTETITLTSPLVVPPNLTLAGGFWPAFTLGFACTLTAGFAPVMHANPSGGSTSIAVEVYNAGSAAGPGTIGIFIIFWGLNQALGI